MTALLQLRWFPAANGVIGEGAQVLAGTSWVGMSKEAAEESHQLKWG